ncbi:hypothetical protein ACFV3O_17240, partial [Streptomyces albidoflavus]
GGVGGGGGGGGRAGGGARRPPRPRGWLIPVAAFAFVRLQAIVLRPGGFMGSLPDLVVLLLLIAPLPALAVAAQRRQRRTLLELP